MNQTRVAVFARIPVLGQVKTRLAAEIGNPAALDCYQKLLQIAIDVASNYHAEIWFDRDSASSKNLYGTLTNKVQPPGDLGVRMFAAFSEGVEVVIGSDIPCLTTEYVGKAIDSLKESDLVLGPVEDGGYCLIAMQRPHRELFLGIDWGTSRVLDQTLEIARGMGLQVKLMPKLRDIDSVQDYLWWQGADTG